MATEPRLTEEEREQLRRARACVVNGYAGKVTARTLLTIIDRLTGEDTDGDPR